MVFPDLTKQYHFFLFKRWLISSLDDGDTDDKKWYRQIVVSLGHLGVCLIIGYYI